MDQFTNFSAMKRKILKNRSEIVSYCSLVIPPPKYLTVNRKLLSDETENTSHGIADLPNSPNPCNVVPEKNVTKIFNLDVK